MQINQLLVFVIPIVCIIFVVILVSRFRSIGTVKESNYYKKQQIMNSSEHTLYLILQQQLGGRYLVFSKVRIEDFVGVRNGLSRGMWQGLRNRIRSNHVDFLICDINTTEPLMAIELDGNSHNSTKKQKRDEFVNNLYESIGLPVKHIKIGSNFEQEVREMGL